jgi:hypothetical protein
MTKLVRIPSVLAVCGGAVAALIATAADAAPLAAEVTANVGVAQDRSAGGGTSQTEPAAATLQEIVVTAEKRSESVQKAPPPSQPLAVGPSRSTALPVLAGWRPSSLAWRSGLRAR